MYEMGRLVYEIETRHLRWQVARGPLLTSGPLLASPSRGGIEGCPDSDRGGIEKREVRQGRENPS